jgi:hypothetical protein
MKDETKTRKALEALIESRSEANVALAKELLVSLDPSYDDLRERAKGVEAEILMRDDFYTFCNLGWEPPPLGKKIRRLIHKISKNAKNETERRRT